MYTISMIQVIVCTSHRKKYIYSFFIHISFSAVKKKKLLFNFQSLRIGNAIHDGLRQAQLFIHPETMSTASITLWAAA